MIKRWWPLGCAGVVGLAVLFAAERAVVVRQNQPPAAAPLPTPNAFDDVKRAGDLSSENYDSNQPDQSPQQNAAVRRRVLAENAEALRVLRAGFDHAYAMPREQAVSGMTNQYYANCRRLARVLSFEATEHAAAGRYAAALDSQLDALRLGADVERGTPLIGQLVGIAAQSLGRQTKLVQPRIDALDAAGAKAAARRLSAILATETVPAETIRSERELCFAMMRADERAAHTASSTAQRLLEPFMFRGHNRYLDALSAWASTGRQGDEPANPAPDAKRFGTLAKMTGEVMPKAMFKWWTNRAANEMFVAALALQSYRAEHGAYPDRLEALVPHILPELPRDPYGAGPLKYRREGDKYVLYSVGPDRKDDGGKAAEKQDEKGQKVYRIDADSVGDVVWGVTQM
jgi:hypothetical protein